MLKRDADLNRQLDQCFSALRASEARFRNIIDKSADGFLILDNSGIIHFANPAAQVIFGRRADELVGELFGFPSVAGETSELTVATQKGRRAVIEMRVVETQWEGEPALLANLRDVTVEKNAVDALRKSEAKYSALIHASSQVFYSMNPDWSEMRQLHGNAFIADTSHPIHNWMQKYIHPDDQKRVREVIDEALRTGTVFELEHRVMHEDGSVGWVASRAIPVKDADGELVEWFGAASDITERKRSEEELRASEERLQKAISIETVGVLFFTLDGHILAANGAFESMSGYTSEELRGIKHWKTLTAPEFWVATTRTAEMLATDGKADPYEKQMTRKDGVRWWGLFAPTRLYGSGESSECIEFIIDITQRKRDEAEIKRLNSELAARTKELEGINVELEAFNYTVAHDLRNPLNTINGYCQAMKMICGKNLDEECSEYLEKAYQGTLRMNRLIDALLNFSRMSRVEIIWERVDLSALVEAAADDLRRMETYRKVTFRIAEGITVDGDAGLLRVVVDNFLGNAWKYTEGLEEAIIEFGTVRGRSSLIHFPVERY